MQKDDFQAQKGQKMHKLRALVVPAGLLLIVCHQWYMVAKSIGDISTHLEIGVLAIFLLELWRDGTKIE
ncbi:MAG: hypothetical protein ACLQM6_07030 [Acidobacteriaceae bacterium]